MLEPRLVIYNLTLSRPANIVKLRAQTIYNFDRWTKNQYFALNFESILCALLDWLIASV